MELIKKYEEFESTVIRVKKIFEKLDSIFNIDEYKRDLSNIEDEVNEIENSKKEQIEIDYSEYIDNINMMCEELNEDYLPFYEIYLFTSYINKLTKTVDENKYSEIKKSSFELINSLNKVEIGKKEDQKKVMEEAYKAIYKAISVEQIIDRNEILDFINKYSKPSIKEHLGLLLRNDILLLPELDQVSIELNHRNEGLECNYLSSDVISKIAINNCDINKEDYQSRKNNATMEILDKIDEIKKEKDELNKTTEERKKIVKKETLRKVGINLKSICAVAASVLIMGGLIYGSTKIDPYHREDVKTYNMETKETINDKTSVYETGDYIYKMEVYKYSPWRTEGNSYVRDVEKWTYKSSTIDEINPEDIIKDLKADKYEYTEEKSSRREEEINMEPGIVVKEYFVDKDDVKPNGAAVLIIGGMLGMIGAMLPLIYFESTTYKDGKRKKEEINNELSRLVSWKTIKESYKKIGDKVVKVQEEIKDTNAKYGDITREITEEEIEDMKKYIYSKK